MSSPIPRQSAHLHTQAKSGAYEVPPDSRASVLHIEGQLNEGPRLQRHTYSSEPCTNVVLYVYVNHKWRELVSSGRFICRCFFSGLTFVLFCFVFCLYAFVEAAALRSIVVRYAGIPIATHVSFFVYLEMSLFPSIFCTISAFSLYGEYVVRCFLPDGVFSRALLGKITTVKYRGIFRGNW